VSGDLSVCVKDVEMKVDVEMECPSRVFVFSSLALLAIDLLNDFYVATISLVSVGVPTPSVHPRVGKQ
jgi:hypothetical protein